MSNMYEPYPSNNFAQHEAYPGRSNHVMGRPMDYNAKPQMRPQQMTYSQPQPEMDYHRSGNAAAMNPPSSSSNSIFPRSASEALFDTTSKFRQLPCRTFISVGTCPYRERCVYLHDPRCICKEAKTKTRRKNKEDVVLDALFWPVMPYPMVAAKLDMNRQPHVIQSYSVPLPQPDQYHKHDVAVYSMWMHFVDFCLANAETMNVRHADSAPCFSAPDVPINSYSEEARLKFFQFLSSCNGRVVSKEDILRCTGAPLSAAAQRHFTAAAVQARRMLAAEDSSNPYFNGSEASQPEMLEPNMRPFRVPEQQMRAQSQAQVLPQPGYEHGMKSMQGTYPVQNNNSNQNKPSSAFLNPGLKVNTTSAVAAFDPRLQSRSSSQSTSPVTVASSPHRGYANNSTQAQAQSRVAIGGALGALGAIGGPSSTTVHHTNKEVPTSLSVLMNSVPHAEASKLAQSKMSLLAQSQHDPWLAESLGLTDSEDRDSGSSYNSLPVQDFCSLWQEENLEMRPSMCGDEDLHAAALSMHMLHDLM